MNRGISKRKMNNNKPKQHSILRFGTIFLILVGIIFSWYWFMVRGGSNQVNDTITQENLRQQESRPVSVDGRYLFNGTLVLARRLEQAAGSDLTQPFSMMHTFEPQKYDAMTVDWECPSTDDIIPYETQANRLIFNCHVKWLTEVAKHFQIVSLASNHTYDLGPEGYQKTRTNLNQAGIQTYGGFEPAVAEDACEVIGLPVRIIMSDDSTKKSTLPIAFCSWMYFYRDPSPGELEVMQRYAALMPVFGFHHTGIEYRSAPDMRQVAVSRKIIDLGAEFSIGNSPHWVQSGEVYKDKAIFYSTGNFMFDQFDEETRRGLSIDVSVNVPYDENIAKWLALAEACKPELHRDDCLEQAETLGLSKYNIQLKYDVVGSYGGANRITTRADAALQKIIEERVGWELMKSQLGQ